jgi:multisubunit Na+/H+ antiporter MnhE subunit
MKTSGTTLKDYGTNRKRWYVHVSRMNENIQETNKKIHKKETEIKMGTAS